LSSVMGNETSSVKIHSLLTADDLKRLRAGFPEGAVGAKPPADLEWGAWKQAWPLDLRNKLQAYLAAAVVAGAGGGGGKTAETADSGGGISFPRYQEMAGNVVRGTTEERMKLLFYLLQDAAKTKENKDSKKQAYEGHIKLSQLVGFVEEVVKVASRLVTGRTDLSPADLASSAILAKSLLKDLAFPDQAAKKCLHLALPSASGSGSKEDDDLDDLTLDFDAVERWTAIKCPLFDQLFRYSLAASFGLQVVDDTIPLQGNLRLSGGGDNSSTSTASGHNSRNSILSPADVFFLNSCLPGGRPDFKRRWRLLFNSDLQGQSFSKLEGALTAKAAQTPTLIVVREGGEGGHVFGGFTSHPWSKPGSQFFGGNSCFLFNLSPRHFAYETTPFNNNYQYYNVNAKTFPNGIGMGGQIDFFGLWLDSEYGKGKCAPSCSSYASPQLSKEESFTFDHVEVWGIGDEPVEDEDEEAASGGGVLDKDPEAMAVMEMMGKTFVSKDVKAADAQTEKDRREQGQRPEEG